MAHEKDQQRPRGRRTFGLIFASAIATAPSLGCNDNANPAQDAATTVTMDGATPMNVVTPMDAAAPVDTATPNDAAAPLDTTMAMDTASAMEAMTTNDAGADARDFDVYPPSTRG